MRLADAPRRPRTSARRTALPLPLPLPGWLPLAWLSLAGAAVPSAEDDVPSDAAARRAIAAATPAAEALHKVLRSRYGAPRALTPSAAPEAPVTGCALAGGSLRGAMLPVDEPRPTERYASLLQCGARRWLLTREDATAAGNASASSRPRRCWTTLARTQRADGSFTPPEVLLNCSMRMSHNTAFACAEATADGAPSSGRSRGSHGARLVAFGNALGFDGLFRAELDAGASGRGGLADLPPAEWQHRWGAPQQIIAADPARSGCVEMRPWLSARGCEYDGKLSLVSHDGRLLLYARANVNSPGGRHVQVASTRDRRGSAGWSAFRVLSFENYTLHPYNNIYYFAVTQRASPSRASHVPLLGVFPGVVNGVAGVFTSESGDGYRWTRPTLLLPSAHLIGLGPMAILMDGGRTSEQPADGLLRPPRRGRDASPSGSAQESAISLVVMHRVMAGGVTKGGAKAGAKGRPAAKPGTDPGRKLGAALETAILRAPPKSAAPAGQAAGPFFCHYAVDEAVAASVREDAASASDRPGVPDDSRSVSNEARKRRPASARAGRRLAAQFA